MEFFYIRPNKKEIWTLFFVSLMVAVLFSLMFQRFEDKGYSLIEIIVKFFIFIFVLECLKLVFMKLIGYRNAFEIRIYQTYFEQYWFNVWDRTSYYLRGKQTDGVIATGVAKPLTKGKSLNFRGFPMSFISVFLYIISFGFFIYPSIWNYKVQKIPHLHAGTKQKFEYMLGHMFNQETSDYRASKALFGGFLFYFVFGIFMKVFLDFFNQDFFNWYAFILYWIAFWSIIPIFGNVGGQLLRRNHFAWISAFVILVLGMISVLIFESMSNVLGFTIVASVIVLLYLLWRYIVYD